MLGPSQFLFSYTDNIDYIIKDRSKKLIMTPLVFTNKLSTTNFPRNQNLDFRHSCCAYALDNLKEYGSI